MANFFCLPEETKKILFEEKNLNDLYEWQKELLNHECIARRKNVIYCVPTSGGKTLVAEILMMKELLLHGKNALFVLPYVSIVQEKVNSLTSLAVRMGFLIEEYAGSKGNYPPVKHKTKNTMFICTIEKALGIVNSLIEEKRLDEVGIAVIDELHLIGESSRGALLENIIIKLINKRVFTISMSATIGNLKELARFMKAHTFVRDFRPTQLKEFIVVKDELFQINYYGKPKIDFIDSELRLDPDRIGQLVKEVIPTKSCLVFCPSKKNCENVSLLIRKTINKELIQCHKPEEKRQLMKALNLEGSLCPILAITIPYGIAYHHSGLTAAERKLVEDAFLCGTLSCICCTSTLATGVNLPAQRVIVRAPYIGQNFISFSKYKQMAGRAGRSGMVETGESYLICQLEDTGKFGTIMRRGVDICISQLFGEELQNFVLSLLSLGMASDKSSLLDIMALSLLKISSKSSKINLDYELEVVITQLIEIGALQKPEFTNLSLTNFGKAICKGNISVAVAHDLYIDLKLAKRHIVLLNDLHLLYLLTPYSIASQIEPVPDIQFSAYVSLKEEERDVAKAIGIKESSISRILSGLKPNNVSEKILRRFYTTLVLYKVWQGTTVWEVATHFKLDRGAVNNLLVTTASFASSVIRFCEAVGEMQCFVNLFSHFPQRLNYCCSAELIPLLELPAVKLGRARQLHHAGFKDVASIARADPHQLVHCILHLPLKQAKQIVNVAKMHLIKQYLTLYDQAEDLYELML